MSLDCATRQTNNQTNKKRLFSYCYRRLQQIMWPMLRFSITSRFPSSRLLHAAEREYKVIFIKKTHVKKSAFSELSMYRMCSLCTLRQEFSLLLSLSCIRSCTLSTSYTQEIIRHPSNFSSKSVCTNYSFQKKSLFCIFTHKHTHVCA